MINESTVGGIAAFFDKEAPRKPPMSPHFMIEARTCEDSFTKNRKVEVASPDFIVQRYIPFAALARGMDQIPGARPELLREATFLPDKLKISTWR
jgi:NifB/MoaA-like Fe-S oxidoreductase